VLSGLGLEHLNGKLHFSGTSDPVGEIKPAVADSIMVIVIQQFHIAASQLNQLLLLSTLQPFVVNTNYLNEHILLRAWPGPGPWAHGTIPGPAHLCACGCLWAPAQDYLVLF
jgi:hypothetical protein